MKNEIYTRIDEEYLSTFHETHRVYMKDEYYRYYVKFCESILRKPLTEDEFYTNMHRRRFQLYQLCCPYCGTVDILINDKRYNGNGGFNYCPNCGRGSAQENIQEQLSRFRRLHAFHLIAIELVSKKSKTDKKVLGYDCYQMEIVAMASIIEILLRDCFESLLFMESGNGKSSYIAQIISKKTGNDFMNIEKANKHFKKAWNIDIKAILDVKIWDSLMDIVCLRNVIVHNNGIVDATFKNTKTYQRVKNQITGNHFFLDEKDIEQYSTCLVDAIVLISNKYLEELYKMRNTRISNYYFNKATFEEH